MNSEENSNIADEALRKIGRNVVNFQKIEGMLKLIISRHDIKGPTNEIESLVKDKESSVEYESLGKLAKEYFGSVYSDPENLDEDTTIENTHFQIRFRIMAEDGSLPLQKTDFEHMVSERNRLIHQMLVRFNPKSRDSCQELINELDKQFETIKRHYTNLRNILLAFGEGMKEIARPDNDDNC